MRLVCLFALALTAVAQKPRNHDRYVPVIIQVPAATMPPGLVSSGLYETERAKPVMREYGALPPALARPLPVVAFLDGRVEPMAGYWVEDAEFIYVTPRKDRVRRANLDKVDLRRTEKLNRQRGIVFRIPN